MTDFHLVKDIYLTVNPVLILYCAGYSNRNLKCVTLLLCLIKGVAKLF